MQRRPLLILRHVAFVVCLAQEATLQREEEVVGVGVERLVVDRAFKWVLADGRVGGARVASLFPDESGARRSTTDPTVSVSVRG